MELGSVLAQGSVVLLDKVPANFILGVGGRGRRVGGRRGVLSRSSTILLLMDPVAICCHLVLWGLYLDPLAPVDIQL